MSGFLSLLVASMIMAAGQASAPSYRLVHYDGEVVAFLDMSNRTKIAEGYRAWSLVVDKPVGGASSHARVLYQFGCVDRTVRALEVVRYGPDGAVQSAVAPPRAVDTNLGPLPVREAFLDTVCAPSNASGDPAPLLMNPFAVAQSMFANPTTPKFINDAAPINRQR